MANESVEQSSEQGKNVDIIRSKNVKQTAVEVVLREGQKKFLGEEPMMRFVENLFAIPETQQWEKSDDKTLQLLYYDFKISSARTELYDKKKEIKSFSIADTSKNQKEVQILEEELKRFEQDRLSLSPYLEEDLRSNNIFSLLAQDFSDNKRTSAYAKNTPFRLFTYYAGEKGLGWILEWLKTNSEDRSLIEFYQELFNKAEINEKRSTLTYKLQEILQIDKWKFPSQDTQESVNLDGSKIIRALVNKYPDIPLDSKELEEFRNIMIDQSLKKRISHVLNFTSRGYYNDQYRKFERGEIDFVPNAQENLRPLTLVDYFDRLIQNREVDRNQLFEEWFSYWDGSMNNAKVEKFIDLILDAGYSNGNPVIQEDRKKVRERLHYLSSHKLDEQDSVHQLNKTIAQMKPEDIVIHPDVLFHETDLSLLDTIARNGVLANEIVYQSRNKNSGGESDLAASFWRFAPYKGHNDIISLRDILPEFFPQKSKVVSTAAKLREKIVIASLNTNGANEEDFYLYPHHYSFNGYNTPLNFRPLIQKFTDGWGENYTNTGISGIYRDGIFVFIGIPNTGINFVMIRTNLKQQYAEKAAHFPFYIPAFDGQTGELLYTSEDFDIKRKKYN